MKKMFFLLMGCLLSVAVAYGSPTDQFSSRFSTQVSDAQSWQQMIEVKQAYDLLKANPEFVMLDVRDPDEVEGLGRPDVPNYLHISRGKLEPTLRRSALTPDTTIILFCKTGQRAALAGNTLRDYGFFGTIYNVAGGMDRWMSDELPAVE